MGNENSQITFPIESSNYYNKVKTNNKKIKYKEIPFKPYENKDKKRKNQKIVKNYEIQRISTTPDRNVYIPGINKETLKDYKRYGSCERDSRINIYEGINKENIKKKCIKNKSINSIFHITNLLNSIYSYGIDKEIGELNSINRTKKQYSKNEGINGIFDATFKYNFFMNNMNKTKRKTNINKIRNKSPIMYDSVPKTKEVNEIRNTKSPNFYNKNDNENQNTHHKHQQNTTLILSEVNMENEVISVNNKKKSSHNNKNDYLKNSNNKKYSESRFVSETESGFISSEEISLLNNIQKIGKKKKEEDASESQTDPKQDTINRNLTNKNKINNNYFIDSQSNKKSNNKNEIRNSINNKIYDNNINNYDLYNNNAIYSKQKSGDKNHDNLYNKNIVICSYDNMNNQIENDKEDEILLMNNESNKDDENNTYIEILKAMTEKKDKNKPEKNYKNSNLNNDLPNKNKKVNKANKVKHYPIKKQITPPNIPFKREITPKSQNTKENITPKNNTNRMILKCKKITPLKKLPININNIKYNTKNKFYNININTNLSPKESSIKKNTNTLNNNNISPRKIFQKKILDKSNNNGPIMTSYGNSIINKNKIHSEINSPSNSPEPSPLNNFNNNYKDRYVYKKMTKITNSIRRSKKIYDYSKSNSNINSIDGNSNINMNGNISNNLVKNSNIYNKVNNTNNTYNTNNYNNNTYFTNNTYIINNTNNQVNSTYVNNSKKIIRNSANKNKIYLMKKERMSANSYNNIQNRKEIVKEPRTKSNDQKYPVYNSKNVFSTTKRKQK